MTGRNSLVLFVGIGCILSSIASAQQPDTILYFPDSMGYCYNPVAIVHNPVTGRVYVANGSDVGDVLVFDPDTRTKTNLLRGFYYCGAYCAGVNRVYLGGDGEVAVLDAESDSLVRVVDVDQTVSAIVYSPTSAKLYLAGDDGETWLVFDPGPDTILYELEGFHTTTVPVWDSATNRVFAAYYEDIEVLDCYGDTLAGGVQFGDDNFTWYLAFSEAGRRLYCNTQWDTVFVVDVDSLRTVSAVGQVRGPIVFNPVLGRLYGSRADSVLVMDCANDSVRALVPVGDYVRSLSVNTTSGRVYVSAYNESQLMVLDAGDSIAQTVALDTAGTQEVMDYAKERNELYCAMFRDNIAIVDGRADTLAGMMRYPEYIIRGMAHSTVGNKLYLLFPDRDTVLVLDRRYQSVAAIPVSMINASFIPVHNPGLNRLYLADSGRLWVVDCTGDSLVGERSLPGFRQASTALLLSSLGKLYVFSRYSPYCAWVYDCLRDQVIDSVQFSRRVTAAAYHPWSNLIYAAVDDDSTVAVLDPLTDSIVKTFRAGRDNSSNEMFANPSNGRVYHVSNSSTERLYSIDARSNLLVDSTDLPDDGDTIFWYQPANKLYLCDRATSAGVTVYDCDTRSILRYLPLPCGYAGAMDEASERLYLGGDGYVNVLDCRTDSVVATYPIPDAPRFSLVNPIDNRVYFAERSNWVAVFQDQLAVEEGSGQGPAVYFGVVSNPVRGRALFRCQVPVGQTAQFSAFDAAGRMVKRMAVAGRNGVSSFVWDRRDERDQRVANGVYFCRLETSAGRAVAKVVLE